ncbi:sulfurtransferase [Tsuneonella sp. YG55]|uniref:Sulfurtransferase n=1 Tax=Tsuneonella litorea TaxID=2976475 RepID=A0A9X2W4R2_9SPHN|nr:sulfurtransferase [Tsuneonella litorea]MCT2560184.1 sulfurtransferase [Tsuneonella litorea]
MESLVSTDWLAQALGADDLVVIDASRHLPATGRDAAAEFLAAHIPGARFLDLSRLADPQSPVGYTLPGPSQAATVLGALGLRREARIVIYDDSAVKTAARAWFILTGYGFEQVAILDGGLAKWRAEGRPVESGSAEFSGEVLAPAAFTGTVRRKAQMRANLDTRAEQVIDARDPGRFTGATADTVHNLPGGHIPGARNLFYRDLYREDGTFRPGEELRAAFEGAGVDLERPIVTSCGSGVTASILLFALDRLGIEGAALYDGSWSEWGADPATPKQTGAAA